VVFSRYSGFLLQAQTVANFFLAFDADLTILPVLNKIDLPGCQIEAVEKQMKNVFDMNPEDILKVIIITISI
jgi:translation elongation factor EF-4